jgi:hypothetical protein
MNTGRRAYNNNHHRHCYREEERHSKREKILIKEL